MNSHASNEKKGTNRLRVEREDRGELQLGQQFRRLKREPKTLHRFYSSVRQCRGRAKRWPSA